MKYLLLSILAIFVMACNSTSSQGQEENIPQEAAEAPDIYLKLQGMGQAEKAYLIGQFADQRFRADSTVIGGDGSIRFQREEPYDPGFYYIFIPNEAVVQLLLDRDQAMTLSAVKEAVVESMQVEGNLNNELLYRNLKFEGLQRPKFDAVNAKIKQATPGSARYAELERERDALFDERKAHLKELFDNHPYTLFTKYKKAGQNPDFEQPRKPDGTIDVELQVYRFRTKFWEGVDFDDERLLHTPVIFNKLKRYITELTAQSPDSIIASTEVLMDKVVDNEQRQAYFKFFANWITLQYEPTKTSLMDPEKVYVFMVQNYFTKERAFWSEEAEIQGLQMRASEMANSLVGNDAPNVIAPGLDGSSKELMALDAPYLIVYMYNPTCEHCMEQTPKLVRFYNEWKSKGVEVYGIALDTNDEEWRQYVEKTGMSWTNVFDPTNRSIYKKYYVDVTPEIYVINPDRKIIAKNLKVHQIETVINRDKAKQQ
ncbi:MAG TPA: redoxin domain-containing protein [Phaeodactylibacter sp.]|nr:redoxin domain-containing protein [Phaeodactylibacter sp.]